MPKRTWIYKENKLLIEVTNLWKLYPWLPSEETLRVNGVILSSKKSHIFSKTEDNLKPEHRAVTMLNGEPIYIRIQLGSKWPGFSMGCHIYVNGILVGGDIDSKLMFV